MPFLRRIGFFALIGALAGGGAARSAPAADGRPTHLQSEVTKALAEAGFKGLALKHPAIAAAYGFYSVAELGRSTTEARVNKLNTQTEDDLKAIDADAAALRILGGEGRFASRDAATCARDPEPCALADRLRARAENLPGGTGRFVARALYDRRTLYEVVKNKIAGKVFGRFGKSLASWLAGRRAIPVMVVVKTGVNNRANRAQWKAIEQIADRFNRLSEKIHSKLIGKALSRMYDEVTGKRLDAAVQRALRSDDPGARDYTIPFRLHIVEAAPVFAPMAAQVARPAAVAAPWVPPLPRLPDPVLNLAATQNHIAHQYEVGTSDAPVVAPSSNWENYQDRSSSIPDVTLPSSSVNWDGLKF